MGSAEEAAAPHTGTGGGGGGAMAAWPAAGTRPRLRVPATTVASAAPTAAPCSPFIELAGGCCAPATSSAPGGVRRIVRPARNTVGPAIAAPGVGATCVAGGTAK
jgi:hypothetical protein